MEPLFLPHPANLLFDLRRDAVRRLVLLKALDDAACIYSERIVGKNCWNSEPDLVRKALVHKASRDKPAACSVALQDLLREGHSELGCAIHYAAGDVSFSLLRCECSSDHENAPLRLQMF